MILTLEYLNLSQHSHIFWKWKNVYKFFIYNVCSFWNKVSNLFSFWMQNYSILNLSYICSIFFYFIVAFHLLKMLTSLTSCLLFSFKDQGVERFSAWSRRDSKFWYMLIWSNFEKWVGYKLFTTPCRFQVDLSHHFLSVVSPFLVLNSKALLIIIFIVTTRVDFTYFHCYST